MKRKIALFISLVVISMVSAGCSNKQNENNAENSTENATEETTQSENNDTNAQNELYLPQLEDVEKGEDIAIIHTNKGDIKVRFFPKEAPKAVENFITHSKEGYYDGIIFHRVIKDFMIQGGDPEGTGRGGESIWGEPFENEESANLRSFRGALCMANTGSDNSNGSQFYIVQNNKLDERTKATLEEYLKSQDEYIDSAKTTQIKDIFPKEVIEEYLKNGGAPHLDSGYTIFGQVYEGMEVVDSIAAVETDGNDKPKEDIIIENIEVGTY